MKTLIVATSHKPPNFFEELNSGQRYQLEYIDLSEHLKTSYMDYDPPWMHDHLFFRKWEEKMHVDFFWSHKVAKIVEDGGYDVVISMSERIAVPLGMMLNKRVKHLAVLINALSPKWLNSIKLLGVHHRWDKIITYSRAETEVLRATLNLDPRKTITIPNYVDLDFFNPSTVDCKISEENAFIMSQGLAKRDYPTLIEAMRQLPSIDCHISAVSAWDKVNAGYEGMSIPSNLILKSYNHPILIRQALAKCKFVVIPLKPDVGMWCSGSTSVLQAQAMGKPVIVTYLPGIAEYLIEHETGFLVEGGNPDQLAEKIDFLWKHAEKAEEMGRKAQAWVRQNFSLDNWIERISVVVDEIVPQKTSADAAKLNVDPFTQA
jgi:glycosyltransferase involved in cell wall biosynthesis